MASPLLLLLLLGLVTLLLIRRRRHRRGGEPPLVGSWLPFLGRALEFGRDAHAFLEEQRKKFGDVFTVHIAGKYMTFIMDPLLFPSVIKHGRQLDFHEFSNKVAPVTFGYPPVLERRFPGLGERVRRSFRLLRGEDLGPLTDSMMANLRLVLGQDHLGARGWTAAAMFDFCSAVIFEASFLTLYGRPPAGRRHADMAALRRDFLRFDRMFPLLIAQVPIWLLGATSRVRRNLIGYFLPHRTHSWTHASRFVRTRAQAFSQYQALTDHDKAAHHFAILWAAVGNTVPACFWTLYHLLLQPAALRSVREEVEAVLSGGGAWDGERGPALGLEQLERLPLLESAIRESLRLCSASINIRVVQEDTCLRLDATRSASVRKGDIIALYPQSLHLDPDVYHRPQTFQVDRFVEDGRAKTDFSKRGQRLKHFLMPFGSGSSKCPGRHFALNEIKQFVSLLLLTFELELEEGQSLARPDPSRAGLGVLQPAADVRFRYRARAPPPPRGEGQAH